MRRPRGTGTIALLALLCVGPLALLTYSTTYLADRAVLREVNARLETTSAVTAVLVQQKLDSVLELTTSYAKRPVLIKALADGDPAAFDGDVIDRQLHELGAAQLDSAGVFFADPACRLTNVEPATPAIVGVDFSFRDWCDGLRRTGRPYISDAYVSAIAGHPVVVASAVTVRVPSGDGLGKPLGIIAAVYTVDAIRAFSAQVAEAQGIGLTITDGRGTVVARPAGDNAGAVLLSAATDPRVRAALAGRSGVSRTNGMLSAFAPASSLGWTVTAEIPAAEALAGVGRMRSAVLGIVVPLGLLLLAGITLLARTLRQRQDADRAVREREASTRAILDAATDAYVSTDHTGVITGWAGNAQAVLGWTEEEALGRQAFEILIPERFRAELQATMTEFLASGDTVLAEERVQITALHRDGHEFPAEVVAWPIREGITWGFNAFLHDITDRKAAEAAVADARDRAIEASQMKSEFLANMSHEIRTPMNGVLGMTSLLLDTDLTVEQRGFAETVTASGEALMTILNDILDFSKIEAGRLDIECVDFDIRALVENVASLLSIPAHDKSLELACSLPVDMPANVKGDPGRLRQVLTNLIGNAVKFTPVGEVVLRLGMTAIDESTFMARFEIADTGIGIATADQPTMFESFAQADAGTTRHYGGTGLGLAISRQLVELMGGEIGVTSALDHGSTFWFTIPLGRGEPVPAPVPGTVLAGQHMLVVDDNATNRAILVGFLRSWGIAVEAVDGGARALEAMAACATRGAPYDAAILDLNMPDMDGIELARRITADRALAPVKLVLLTSSGRGGEAAEAMDAGICAYLTKPVRPAQLHDRLAAALAAAPADAALSPALAPTRPIPAARLRRILLAEDNEVNQRVATAMLRRLGFEVDVAVNGSEAVKAAALSAYEAILMDCQMPIVDGYDATREIRRQQGSSGRTPIIALTASAMKSDPQRCQAAGMDDFLSKPLSLRGLETMLDRWAPAPDGDRPLVPT
jgi:PAS domain S-box-containing protein